MEYAQIKVGLAGLFFIEKIINIMGQMTFLWYNDHIETNIWSGRKPDKMEIKTLKTYSFTELSEEVQADLIDENRAAFADSNSEFIGEMFCDSRKAFEDIFGLSSFSTECTLLDEDLRGVRLATWINNNIYDKITDFKTFILTQGEKYKIRYSSIIINKSSVLTGTASDDYFTQPIFDFLANPDSKTSLSDLVYECLENARVGQDQWNNSNYFYDEGIKNYLINREEKYTVDGELIDEYDMAA